MAGITDVATAIFALLDGLVKVLSSFRISLELPVVIVSGTAAGLSGRVKRPNPERRLPNAISSAFRHHGIVFSTICIS
jgi:hypothetical protein